MELAVQVGGHSCFPLAREQEAESWQPFSSHPSALSPSAATQQKQWGSVSCTVAPLYWLPQLLSQHKSQHNSKHRLCKAVSPQLHSEKSSGWQCWRQCGTELPVRKYKIKNAVHQCMRLNNTSTDLFIDIHVDNYVSLWSMENKGVCYITKHH